MVRDDIMGMLKVALQKRKNLPQIIQSLYNSGYSKEEVDEAVKLLDSVNSFQPVQITPAPKTPMIQQPKQSTASVSPGQTKQIVSAYPYNVQQPVFYQPQPVYSPVQPAQAYQPNSYPAQFIPAQQIVSNYGQPKKFSMGKTITIIMVVMLMILLGILAVVIMFKPELENFINNL